MSSSNIKPTDWKNEKDQGVKDESFDIDKEYEAFIERTAENSFENKAGKGKSGFWATIFKLIMGKKLQAKIEK
jgi:hypothetical protein